MCGEHPLYIFVISGTLSCHRMNRVTADVLPLHALLTHLQEGKGGLEKC